MHVVAADRIIIRIVSNVDVNGDMSLADVAHQPEALGVAADIIAFVVFVPGAVVDRHFSVGDAFLVFCQLDRRGKLSTNLAVAGLGREIACF